MLLGVIIFIWFLITGSKVKNCWSEAYSKVTNTTQEEFPPKNFIKVSEEMELEAQRIYVECLEKDFNF